MKTAYSFIWWSTKKGNKAQSRDTKSRQLNSAKEWCAENGYTLSPNVYIGANESGFKAKHLKVKDGVAIGALARFIASVENGSVKSGEVLCIDSVDRFSRQEILDALEPFTKLLNLGIGIVFTGSPLRKLLTRELINKEPHWLQWLINDMIRSWTESAEKSRKVKSGLKRVMDELKSGETNQYHRAPKFFTWKDGKYVLNEKAKTVQDMAQMIIEGHSLRSIAIKFNLDKVPTLRRDTEWSTTTVRKVLKSRTVIGELFGKKDFFPHVLTATTFDKVQAVLGHNKSFNRGRVATYVNVFRGLAFCQCGKAMNSITQTKDWNGNPLKDLTKYRYFRCTTTSIGKACQHRGLIKLADLEEEFFGNFLLRDPKELIADKPELTKLHAAKAKVAAKIAEIEDSITEAVKMIRKKLAVKALEKELTTLEAEKGERQAELDSINSHINKISLTPQHFDDLKKLCKAFDLEDDGATSIGGDLKLHLSPKARAFDNAIQRMNETLKDNEVRMKIKAILPTLIGKVVVNAPNKSFEVFNHAGESVYQSLEV